MESIIKKAIEGGYLPKLKSEMILIEIELPTARETIKYGELKEKYLNQNALLDPLFWQSLGKSCGWEETYWSTNSNFNYLKEAQEFHRINLTEGWDAAVKYLQDLLTPSSTKEGEMK